MNKTKQAKRLGISRPTLYKKIKEGALKEQIDIEKEKLAIKLQAICLKSTPYEIDRMIEFLGDYNFLNDEGKQFASAFWRVFIKE